MGKRKQATDDASASGTTSAAELTSNNTTSKGDGDEPESYMDERREAMVKQWTQFSSMVLYDAVLQYKSNSNYAMSDSFFEMTANNESSLLSSFTPSLSSLSKRCCLTIWHIWNQHQWILRDYIYNSTNTLVVYGNLTVFMLLCGLFGFILAQLLSRLFVWSIVIYDLFMAMKRKKDAKTKAEQDKAKRKKLIRNLEARFPRSTGTSTTTTTSTTITTAASVDQ
eukprot:GEZU01004128.1.p1 GENE.GEZU01004128.1~~GEZU01004128.1.p1  ORF type:complete len:224 (-),score=54.18 GEZU01004128.1:20-691(-)